MARRNQNESYIESSFYKASNYSEIRAVYFVCTKKRQRPTVVPQHVPKWPAFTSRHNLLDWRGEESLHTFTAIVQCHFPAKAPLFIPKRKTFRIAKFK